MVFCGALNIKCHEERIMRPSSVVGLTIFGATILVAFTVYGWLILSNITERLTLVLVTSELIGFGGLISAEAYVFLWNIRALPFG